MRSSSPTLGVIVSQFPEFHETFIARELQALKDAGVQLRIYSLKRCRDAFVHPEASSLVADTTYAPWNSPRVWGVALWRLVRHPVLSLRTLCWAVRHHCWSLAILSKTLVAVTGTRTVRKSDMVHNGYTPQIEVDPQTYEVRADGDLLT